MYKKFIKRIIDLIISLICLLLFLPILIIIIIILLYANRGKPFFYQKRPGLNEKVFTIVKFKTMNDKKDKKGKLLPNELRITKVGNIIRKTSLDEIPQLINVLIGDMSLIGPRPLLPKYLPLYNVEQKKRHNVKPGITGWAQVNGRNAINWKKKFKYDIEYIENLSFLMDLKIIYLTIMKVLMKEGINNDEDITMEAFNGNN